MPMKKAETTSAEAQLDRFLDAYTPEIAAFARVALAKMRKRLPHAVEMVYDNYNALVCGFGPTERASEAVFSIVMFPKYVSLCFLQGAVLPDPKGLLEGEGNVVRHIRLQDQETLDRADVKAMMATAMKMAKVPFDMKAEYKLVIKSISAKQRPRRPTPVKTKREK
ncbi:MAG TPA: DUF1801 domain-containing protein [Edaphobacter sp.]|nr:DUF1801 domain-containing protein [Edaphobacter sp.]